MNALRHFKTPKWETLFRRLLTPRVTKQNGPKDTQGRQIRVVKDPQCRGIHVGPLRGAVAIDDGNGNRIFVDIQTNIFYYLAHGLPP
ncbi:hypothetical protein DESC_860006 [Desulfosarcina cetonica]|nr:hypothetical protein DESC_860006 [Desulfosarcina cetonica]